MDQHRFVTFLSLSSFYTPPFSSSLLLSPVSLVLLLLQIDSTLLSLSFTHAILSWMIYRSTSFLLLFLCLFLSLCCHSFISVVSSPRLVLVGQVAVSIQSHAWTCKMSLTNSQKWPKAQETFLLLPPSLFSVSSSSSSSSPSCQLSSPFIVVLLGKRHIIPEKRLLITNNCSCILTSEGGEAGQAEKQRVREGDIKRKLIAPLACL